MLNVKQASTELGISPSTLYGLVSRREISFLRIGSRILFEPEDLKAFKAKCRVGAEAKLPPPPPPVKLKHVSLVGAGTRALARGGRSVVPASTCRLARPARQP